MLVLRRWSEFWMRVPASVALPLSSTAKSVVDALLTTEKAVVEAVVGSPDLQAAVWVKGADTDIAA